jgi:ankyrin repeat protein
VNARDRWGKSILDAAKQKGDEEVVALLLSKGAEPGPSAAQASGK